MNTTFEKLCCGAGATHEMSFFTGVEMGAKPLGSAPAPSVINKTKVKQKTFSINIDFYLTSYFHFNIF